MCPSNCDQLCKATHLENEEGRKDNEEKTEGWKEKGVDENHVHDDLLHEWLELVLRLGFVGFIFVPPYAIHFL